MKRERRNAPNCSEGGGEREGRREDGGEKKSDRVSAWGSGRERDRQ